MAFKLIVLAAIVAVARAGVIGAPAVLAPGAPLGYGPQLGYGGLGVLGGLGGYGHGAVGLAGPAIAKVAVRGDDYDPNPQYSYAYDVQDALTGDSKGQQETRSGDVVQGSYNLVEPDGTRRIVEYTADPVNGFNAVVHRQPLGVAKAVVAAPAIAKVAVGGLGLAGPGLVGAGYGGLGYGRGLVGAGYGGLGHGLAGPLGYGGAVYH